MHAPPARRRAPKPPPRAPAAAPAPAPSPAPSPAPAPQFAPLLLAALDAVGVAYVSMDHLRKAKRDALDEREYRELWKLLHDVVLVVLADFAVDADEMRRMNAPRELEAALWDAHSQRVRVELVRFYLYDWGFVCSSFYAVDDGGSASVPLPKSSDLLLALSWLLAFSRFFERLHAPILERFVGKSAERSVLPPYPNDVVLSEAQVAQAVDSVLAAAATSSSAASERPEEFEATIHQLHAAFGRLQGYVSDLQAQLRFHQRLLLRLEAIQCRAPDQRDELLPAFVIQLFAQPKSALEAHLRLLAHRVKMVEDEKLFYKWVNSLVASYPAAAREATSTASLADVFPSLHAEVRSAHALFEANAAAFEALGSAFTLEWRKWKQAKHGPARTQQMTAKMARVAQDVNARELFDPHKLFTQSAQSWGRQTRQQPQDTVLVDSGDPAIPAAATQPLAREQDLESLRRQLEQVIREISTEYCGAQLR